MSGGVSGCFVPSVSSSDWCLAGNRLASPNHRGMSGFEQEFRLLALEDRQLYRPEMCSAARLQGNSKKNRYGDILPYDRYRVCLKTLEPDECDDYINASRLEVGWTDPRVATLPRAGPHNVDPFPGPESISTRLHCSPRSHPGHRE